MTRSVEPGPGRVDVIAPHHGLWFVHPRYRVRDPLRRATEWGREVREVSAVRDGRVFHRLVGTRLVGAHMAREAFLGEVRAAFRPCPAIAPPEAWVVLCRALGNHGRELPADVFAGGPLAHPWLVSQGFVERVDGWWRVTAAGRSVALLVLR